MKINYSLYLVTDRKNLKTKTLAQAVEEAILAGVTIVQLREKNISPQEFRSIALEVQKITTKYCVPLVINDNQDVAREINADGIHLGQSDNYLNVRDKFPKSIIGISASTPEEFFNALKQKPDYIGIGSFFETTTKQDAKVIDLSKFQDIFSSSPIPIVAIGGITKEKIPLLKTMNIHNFAFSSAILNNENKISENTKKIKESI